MPSLRLSRNAPMKDRITELRARLEAENCDSFISFSSPTNRYLTGFSGTTSALVVTSNEALFLCDFRYVEQAYRQVRGCEIKEIKGCLEIRAAERLAAAGTQKTCFDPTTLTVHQLSLIKRGYHGTLEPVVGLVAGMRMRKTEAEVDRIQAAVDIAEAALAATVDSLYRGITEKAVAARLDDEFRQRGASGPSFDTIVLFGARSSLPHGAPSNRTLTPGDIVLIDCGCLFEGYCSDLTRTYAFGTIPTTWFEEIYAVTLSAQQAALAAVKAGVSARTVDAAARNMICGAGYGDRFGHGLGHGVGLEVHESPRLNVESETVLEPGMVVTIEPGIYLPGRGGVRIEDMVVVTESGCRVFTQSPKQLKVLKA